MASDERSSRLRARVGNRRGWGAGLLVVTGGICALLPGLVQLNASAAANPTVGASSGPAVLAPAIASSPGNELEPVRGGASFSQTSTIQLPQPLRMVWQAPTFGRYAIWAESAVGVQLKTVDRNLGPRSTSGAAGGQDGRWDGFLESGPQLVLGNAPAAATGPVKLHVKAFQELNGETSSTGEGTSLPRLNALTNLQSTLGDFEQRSYWLDVKEGGSVAIEVLGRYVSDLRLWRDGAWMTDDVPACRMVSQTSAQAGNSGRNEQIERRTCLLAATPPAGRYKVTVYGGTPTPQADGGDDRTIWLRSGLETTPVVFRQQRTISPFGVDRVLVAGTATSIRLELAKTGTARLTERPYTGNAPFASATRAAYIETKTNPPVAGLSLSNTSPTQHLITVEGNPGTSYILQAVNPSSMQLVAPETDGNAVHYAATLQVGDPQDSLDSTALIVRARSDGRQAQVVASSTISLSQTDAWARRFNLNGPSKVFVEIKAAGKYRFESGEAPVRLSMEPFFVERPASYEPPPLRETPQTLSLNPGIYVLNLEPLKPGVTALVAAHERRFEEVKASAAQQNPVMAVKASSVFERLQTERGFNYMLMQPGQSNVARGTFLTRLPLTDDSTDPVPAPISVPVFLAPKATLKLPVHLTNAQDAVVNGAMGASITVGRGALGTGSQLSLPVGDSELWISNPGETPISGSLELKRTVPVLREPYVPPVLPVMSVGQPLQIALKREASLTSLVDIKKAGRYRIESLGRMMLSGQLRTRTALIQPPVQGNGVGWNFRIDAWLLPGQYQATVNATQLSQGSATLQVVPMPLREVGSLTFNTPTQTLQKAGEGLLFNFKIETKGEYKINAFRSNRFSLVSLVDEDGWPLMPPGKIGDLQMTLTPGRYTLGVLPESVEGRTQALISPVTEPEALSGHGPHRIPLAEMRSNQWQESAEGQERQRDVWLFDVPASSTLAIALTGEMEGYLFPQKASAPASSQANPSDTSDAMAWIPPQDGWKGTLPAGSYRLEVQSYRRNDRQPYEIAIWPFSMMDGLTRRVPVPTKLPITIGQVGAYTLSSFCGVDVQGSLTDAAGRQVARGDDAADDWNFRITQQLQPGDYSLDVRSVDGSEGVCDISLRRLSFQTVAARNLPVDATWVLSNAAPTDGASSGGDAGTAAKASGQSPALTPAPTPALTSTPATAQTAGTAIEVPISFAGEKGRSSGAGPAGSGAGASEVSALLRVQAEAGAPIGMQVALEGAEALNTPSSTGTWLDAGTGRSPELWIPVSSRVGGLRVRVWSQGPAGSQVRLKVTKLPLPTQSLGLTASSSAGGAQDVATQAVALKPLGQGSELNGVAIRVDQPLAVRFWDEALKGSHFCESLELPCLPLSDAPGDPFREPRLLPSQNSTLVVVGPASSKGKALRLSAQALPAQLLAGQAVAGRNGKQNSVPPMSLQLPVKAESGTADAAGAGAQSRTPTMALRLEPQGSGPMLLLASGGQAAVGARIVPDGQAAAASAMSPGRAAGAEIPADLLWAGTRGTALFWNAQAPLPVGSSDTGETGTTTALASDVAPAGASAGGPQSVRLQLLQWPGAETLLWGSDTTGGTVSTGAAGALTTRVKVLPERPVVMELPPGRKQLQVTLSGNLLAALVSGTTVERILWEDGKPLRADVTTTAQRLALFPVPEYVLLALKGVVRDDKPEPVAAEGAGTGSAQASISLVSQAATSEEQAYATKGAAGTTGFEAEPLLTTEKPLVLRFLGEGTAWLNLQANTAKSTGPADTAPGNASTGSRSSVASLATASAPVTVMSSGPVSGLTWTANGQRLTGSGSMLVPGSGLLSFEHGPGTVVFWLTKEKRATPSGGAATQAVAAGVGASEQVDPWQVDDAKPLQMQSLTSVLVNQSQRAILLPGLAPDAALQVVASSEVIATLTTSPARGGSTSTIPPAGKEGPQRERIVYRQRLKPGAPLLVPVSILQEGQGASGGAVPSGASGAGVSTLRLSLRSVDGQSPIGPVLLQQQAVRTLSDGLGPETLLGPGDTQLFRLEVTRPGVIGVGLRANRDGAEAQLLNSKGETLEAGVVMMPDLQKGTYFLKLFIGMHETPILVRPVVVGLTEPSQLPPQDVRRKFVEAGGSSSVARIVAPNPPMATAQDTWNLPASVLNFGSRSFDLPPSYQPPLDYLSMEGHRAGAGASEDTDPGDESGDEGGEDGSEVPSTDEPEEGEAPSEPEESPGDGGE